MVCTSVKCTCVSTIVHKDSANYNNHYHKSISNSYYNELDVQGHLEVIKYLTEAGADVTVEDKDGHTPVYIASEHVSTDKVIYNKVLYMSYHWN